MLTNTEAQWGDDCVLVAIVQLQDSPYLSSLAFASVFPVSISLSVDCYSGVSLHAVGG
jgi:hypothetical protein